MKGLFFLGLFVSPFVDAKSTQNDTLITKTINEVVFVKKSPIAKEVIQVSKDLNRNNLGQDLPILLKNQTSVLSTSDAGNGIGYTGLRIRGVGGNSINVMMNGVPYNDSESQGTFFVNVPDLTSSASQIVIQRGVGTSSNGVSAFGASVNIVSKDPESQFYVKTNNSVGSFNTYKYAAEVSTGKLWNNRLSFLGRVANIHSDGYIDRASSDLNSYSFTGLYEQNKTTIRLMAFGGEEKTYQAWNGIDREMWKKNPKYNYSGAIYNSNWSDIIGFYDNETDNYKQSHYQLYWKEVLNSIWSLENTLHYTKGKGYYENYKQDSKLSKYNLPNQGTITRTDFIRKKWLDNDFYGVVSNLYGNFSNLNLHIGAVANQYFGRHFGEVSSPIYTDIKDHEYYRNNGLKNEISGFTKAIYRWNNFEIYGDIQLRNISYNSRILQKGDDEGLEINKKWTFINPKAGFSYLFPKGKAFVSYALAHREPNRDDLISNTKTNEEQLNDYEVGIEYQFGDNISFAVNGYYMDYKDQLVLSGVINDVGELVRENVEKSYRTGLEFSLFWKTTDKLTTKANATFSRNKITSIRKHDEMGEIVNLKNADISFSPSMLGNLSFQYQFSKQFSLGLVNQYVGSQYLNNMNDENLKLSDYFTADLTAQYELKINRAQLILNLLVNNILDRKYVNNGYVYGSDPYYFPQAGINFLLGMSLKFQ